MKLIFRCLFAINIFVLSGCITTPEDVIEQYDLWGPIGFAEYFVDVCPDEDLWIQTIKDSLLTRVEKLPLEDILKFGDVIIDTRAYPMMSTLSLDKSEVLDYFRKCDYKDGILRYNKYAARHAVIDSVFTKSIFPVLLNAPYPVLKEMHSMIQDSIMIDRLDFAMRNTRDAYLMEIKDEIEVCKLSAVQAFDQVTEPTLALALDSLSFTDMESIKKKVSGSSFKLEDLKDMFSPANQKLFGKKWDSVVKGDNYVSLFNVHINSTLHDVYEYQNEMFLDLIGTKPDIKHEFLKAPTLAMPAPEVSESLMAQYISRKTADNMLDDPLSFLSGPMTQMAEGVMTAVVAIVDVAEAVKEELSPEDKFSSFIQTAILSSIPEDYVENIRAQYIELVNSSYDNLFEKIKNEI